MIPRPADLRRAARSLRRAPGVAIPAVATLALGLGALAAVFGVVDAVLIDPLPYPQPDRLVAAWEQVRTDGGAWRVAPANFADWRRAAPVPGLAAFGGYEATLTGRGEPRVVRGNRVTAGYFETLGRPPLHGRTIGAEDERDDARVAVLGHALWTERFAGDPAVVGTTVLLDGVAHTVVGVAPPGLYPSRPANGPRLRFDDADAELFVPLGAPRLTARRSHILGVVARLAPDDTVEAAGARLRRVADRLSAEHPENAEFGVTLRPLADELVGDVRRPLALLLGAALLVLLVAGANVGGLLVARAELSRHEVALERALGAGVPRLARRFLAEAAVLAAAGAATGLVAAAIALPILLRWAPAELPRLADATIDLRAFGVAAGAALVSAALVALLPLAASRRAAPADALREAGGRTAGSGARRQLIRRLLVAAQLGLAVALAVAATLLVESFRHLRAVDPGVATDDVTVVDLGLSGERYRSPEPVVALFRQLVERLDAHPAVASAQVAYDHPLDSNWINSFALVGRDEPEATPWLADLRFVSPGYFAALDVAVARGREFGPEDDARGRPVAVVDREFVRRHLGGVDPIGTLVECSVGRWSWGEGLPERFEIVGVVDNVRPLSAGGSTEPTLYLDAWQIPQSKLRVLVRGAGSPARAVDLVRSTLGELDPSQALGDVTTLARERAAAVAEPRFSMRLMTVLGGLALLLAAAGVYGVVTAWVGARSRELGVRRALGAERSRIVALVLRQGVELALLGAAAGLGGALVLGRLLSAQLHGVSAVDGPALVAAPLVVAAAALLACLPPALRAARIDPGAALRDE